MPFSESRMKCKLNGPDGTTSKKILHVDVVKKFNCSIGCRDIEELKVLKL